MSDAANPARLIPAGRRARGTVRVPPSKSVSHRMLNLVLLSAASAAARGSELAPGRIDPLLQAEDTALFLEALRRAGLEVQREGSGARVGGRLDPGAEVVEISCGNAGTMYRFLVASFCAVPGRWRLDGTARLRQRPVGPLLEALRPLGAQIRCLDREGYGPLEIEGGSLTGGTTRLDAGESSQYLSALLQAAHLARRPVEVEVTALTSSPYLDLTLRALETFGGRVHRRGPGPGTFRVEPRPLTPPPRLGVEGDFSAAAYPVAAAVLTGGRVEILGLEQASAQGDRAFLDHLEAMGAELVWRGRGEAQVLEVRGPREGDLAGIAADLSATPDQVPTLAALAPFARGTTRIENVPHLRIKESDRLAAMARELGRLGARVEELEDGLVIEGIWAHTPPPGEDVEVATYDDHRIAMSLALVGLRRPGVRVADPDTVGKSYPAFWHDLETLVGP